jgi:ferredoxin-NADP reductase
MVKRYPAIGDNAPGYMSNHLFGLQVGAEVNFKHISFNVKIQYPFKDYKTISMVCGGTGIAPMYQALQSLLQTEGD